MVFPKEMDFHAETGFQREPQEMPLPLVRILYLFYTMYWIFIIFSIKSSEESHAPANLYKLTIHPPSTERGICLHGQSSFFT